MAQKLPRLKKIFKKSLYIFAIYFAAFSVGTYIAAIQLGANAYSVREYSGFDSTHPEFISAVETFDYPENLQINSEKKEFQLDYIDSQTLTELDSEISETPLKHWTTGLLVAREFYVKGYQYRLVIEETITIILEYDESGIRQVVQENGENKTIVDAFGRSGYNWYLNTNFSPVPTENRVNITFEDVIWVQIEFRFQNQLRTEFFNQYIALNNEFQVLFVIVCDFGVIYSSIIQPYMFHLCAFTYIVLINSLVEIFKKPNDKGEKHPT